VRKWTVVWRWPLPRVFRQRYDEWLYVDLLPGRLAGDVEADLTMSHALALDQPAGADTFLMRASARRAILASVTSAAKHGAGGHPAGTAAATNFATEHAPVTAGVYANPILVPQLSGASAETGPEREALVAAVAHDVKQECARARLELAAEVCEALRASPGRARDLATAGVELAP
jgi:hypothetical protein